MSFIIGKNHPCVVEYDATETDAVKIAAENLKKDIVKVFGEGVLCEGMAEKGMSCQAGSETGGIRKVFGNATACNKIIIHTAPGTFEHKETYQIKVENGNLYIIGEDRRGTVYGIYELSQRLGVSPWYFFADVPVKCKDIYELADDFECTDYPTVEYRGIFINDEEELETWVQNYLGEETIGVKAYEIIFELLLRLKANYIWPAMHVNSFNVKVENGALAEKMGIVVGTSHCDMLMRSNNREWKPWIEKKGYEGVRYDYSLPGRNREILQEYWRESVEQNKDFEVCYTIGMRGIHDSGFEVEALKDLTGDELKQAKIALLRKVMTDQQEILHSTLGHETMMTFVPYKEVLPLYDGGLEVPEDITLVWANDNYGHIRRYPSAEEQKRRGGHGIYYHNSYWAPPGLSYVFLCSIPLAHTANELRKAYAEGVRKLWVMNVGAMKPLEQEIEFFLRLAWEITKENALTDDVEGYVEDWINRNFSGNIGAEVSQLLNTFSQITNVRKPELMDYDAFSQTAYGDEAAVRIHIYEDLFARGNAIYDRLPQQEKDAFFQMVLMRIHAAYYTNLAYYYGDRSTLMCKQGKYKAAAEYVKKSREMEDARRRMVIYYNTIMADGKWNGIVNPEGFPPPRAAMMPLCTPPLWSEGGGHEKVLGAGQSFRQTYGDAVEGNGIRLGSICVNLWNEEQELTFVQPGTKWLEIGNGGQEPFDFTIGAPEWVKLSQVSGKVETECRVLAEITDVNEDRSGKLVITANGGAERTEIPVRTIAVKNQATCKCVENGNEHACEKGTLSGIGNRKDVLGIEDGGMVSVDAETAVSPDFKVIKRLGRGAGNLVEASVQKELNQNVLNQNVLNRNVANQNASNQNELQKAADSAVTEIFEKDGRSPLNYKFILTTEGEHLLEIHRFPSLNSVGNIRIGVAVDDGEVTVLATEANDEHRGTWKENVRNNVDRMYWKLPKLTAGEHTISFYAVDKYFAFSRFVIYTRERKHNNFIGVAGCQALPAAFDGEAFAKTFYGEIGLKPRPVEYAYQEHLQHKTERDTLLITDLIRQEETYAAAVEPQWYLERGKKLFAERNGMVCIDAATVLAESENAYTTGDIWDYCGSESYGRSGLAMYIRERGLKWDKCADAPSLNYRFSCEGGAYTIWALAKFSTREEAFFGVGVDGNAVEGKDTYGKGCLWRYEAEQIYRYVPLTYIDLTAGEHVLHIYSKASSMRIDRICLVNGEELPPMDSAWRCE